MTIFGRKEFATMFVTKLRIAILSAVAVVAFAPVVRADDEPPTPDSESQPASTPFQPGEKVVVLNPDPTGKLTLEGTVVRVSGSSVDVRLTIDGREETKSFPDFFVQRPPTKTPPAEPAPLARIKPGDKVEVLVEEPSGMPTEIGVGKRYVGEVVGLSGGGLYVDVKFTRNGQAETKSFLAAFVAKTGTGELPAGQSAAATPKTDLPRFATAALRASDRYAYIGKLLFAPDGQTIVGGYDEKEFGRWDATTGRKLPWNRKANLIIAWCSIVPTMETLAVLEQKNLSFYSLSEPQDMAVVVADFEEDRSHRAFAFRPDGAVAATASMIEADFLSDSWKDLRIELWDVSAAREAKPPTKTGELRPAGGFEIDNAIQQMAFSPDGDSLALLGDSRGKGRVVELWDVGRQRRSAVAALGADRKENGLAFSPKGDLLAAGSRVYDAKDLSLRTTLEDAHEVAALAFSPDGSWLVTGGVDRHLAFWDPATGKKKAAFRAADRPIESVAVSSDGARLASSAFYAAEDNGVAFVWDVAAVVEAAPRDDYVAKLAALPHGAEAWRFGWEWSEETFSRAEGGEASAVWGASTLEQAQTLGLTPPAPPPATESVAWVMTHLAQNGQNMAKEIERKHGGDQAKLFTLAVQLQIIERVYKPNPEELGFPKTDGLLKNVRRFVGELGLPAEVAEPLADRMEAKAYEDDVTNECYWLRKEIEEYLKRRPATN